MHYFSIAIATVAALSAFISAIVAYRASSVERIREIVRIAVLEGHIASMESFCSKSYCEIQRTDCMGRFGALTKKDSDVENELRAIDKFAHNAYYEQREWFTVIFLKLGIKESDIPRSRNDHTD